MACRSGWRALVHVGCLGLLAGCGTPQDAVVPNDASSASDAGFDAGFDASFDASTIESGADAIVDATVDAAGPDAAVDGSSDASACHLVVNEIRTGDGVSASDEYVELYNPCGAAFTFPPNWYIVTFAPGDSSYSRVGPLTALTIAAGAHWLAVGTGYSYVPAGNLTFPAANLIDRTGGNVALGSFPAPNSPDGSFVAIDSVRWGVGGTSALAEGNPANAPNVGKSLARKPNGNDSNSNDVDFANDATPTPKSAN